MGSLVRNDEVVYWSPDACEDNLEEECSEGGTRLIDVKASKLKKFLKRKRQPQTPRALVLLPGFVPLDGNCLEYGVSFERAVVE